MDREDDLVLYLEDKEKLDYLINEYGKEGYPSKAVEILIELFGIQPNEVYLGKLKDDSSIYIMYGMFFCDEEKVYEFELMREDLSFRFRKTPERFNDVTVIKVTVEKKKDVVN